MQRCTWSLVMLSSLVATAGCASTLPPDKSTYAFDRRCQHVPVQSRNMPVSDGERRQASTEREALAEAVELYTPTAVHIADVMGLLLPLNRLAQLEARHAAGADIERVRRKLLSRLQLASLEVSGLVSEIECEVQRTDQVQDHLKDIQSTRTTSKTILGVIFGGLANILSGGIGMATGAGDAGNIASTTGGALEVLFGTSANFTKVRQEFSHPHNHLAAIWDGSPKAELFSSSVWRFLTESDGQDPEGHSLRDIMLQTWREGERLGTPGSAREKERITLLFGTGGVYDSEQLHVREAMLQQLESCVQLMDQHLETLLREVLTRQAMEED
jgi:hypothetical protein